MPIYDYYCEPCNLNIQIFCEIEERHDQTCEKCKDFLNQMVSVFANTPGRWGESHGYFDRGLGCYVANSMERDKIMKEKNLRPVSQNELVDHQSAVDNEHTQHNKDVEKFSSVLKETGDFAQATKQTFPDHHPLADPEPFPLGSDLGTIETKTTNKDNTP